MLDDEQKKEVQKMINENIAKATRFSKRKIGDTPTDDNQLVPKKYVDGILGSSSVISSTATFSSTSVIGVTTNFRPRVVFVSAVGGDSSGGWVSFSNGNWSSVSGNFCVYQRIAADGSGLNNGASTVAWNVGRTANTHIGVIASVTSTGFSLVNTKTSSPADATLLWIAQ